MGKSTNNRRPSVFIGSSGEGFEIAENVQVLLDRICEVTIWSQGMFGLSDGTLESLVKSVDQFDFAILILTPDDLTESRGATQPSPRDNVLFELGLFIGGLGRERVFAIYDRAVDLKLPSDLAGISLASFHRHATGNLLATLGAPCTQIKSTIQNLGLRAQRRTELFFEELLESVTRAEDHDIYFCYSGRDRDEVVGIADALKAEGYAPYLFDNGQVGINWVDRMQDKLCTAKAIAVCLGANGLSPWQTNEFRVAIQQYVLRSCPLIPIMLKNYDYTRGMPPLLNQFIAVDMRGDTTNAVKQLIRALGPPLSNSSNRVDESI